MQRLILLASMAVFMSDVAVIHAQDDVSQKLIDRLEKDNERLTKENEALNEKIRELEARILKLNEKLSDAEGDNENGKKDAKAEVADRFNLGIHSRPHYVAEIQLTNSTRA